MPDSPLMPDQSNLLLEALVGMPVSSTWNGYGSAIFLELGNLAPLQHSTQRYQQGDATMRIEWNWRIEEMARVVVGSSNSRPKIKAGIDTLNGTSITHLSIRGVVPELFVTFSNGVRLISAAMRTDTSGWCIRLPSDIYVYCESGTVYCGAGAATGLTPEEEAVFEHAETTVKRWNMPIADEPGKACGRCIYLVYLDGTADFLDCGVCTCADSPFDGRVISITSGCPAFCAYQA